MGTPALINKQDKHGRTAVAMALQYNYSSCAAILGNRGADLSLQPLRRRSVCKSRSHGAHKTKARAPSSPPKIVMSEDVRQTITAQQEEVEPREKVTTSSSSMKGTPCRGITPAWHAGGPGFIPQRVP